MKNKKLLELKKNYPSLFSYFKDDNILVFSEDKATLPFAYVSTDTAYPTNLIINYATNYDNPTLAVDLALTASRIQEVALGEEFFVSNNGQTYWGVEARDHYLLENIDLKELPSDGNLH